MSDPRVLLDKDHESHIARLTLNNPDRKNSYDPEMRRAMGAALEDVANDDDIEVLLLRGAGSVFCAGADVAHRAEELATQIAKMPADGIAIAIAIAKEAYRLVEQSQAYQGEESASVPFHAFATNFRFEEDEFNFVKERGQSGTTEAFESRDAHFIRNARGRREPTWSDGRASAQVPISDGLPLLGAIRS